MMEAIEKKNEDAQKLLSELREKNFLIIEKAIGDCLDNIEGTGLDPTSGMSMVGIELVDALLGSLGAVKDFEGEEGLTRVLDLISLRAIKGSELDGILISFTDLTKVKHNA